jgi:DNA-directed RNA polymerase subunit beta
MVKDVYFGNTLRKSFARKKTIIEMPALLDIQKESYRWFFEVGLGEVFRDVGTITDYQGNLELSFIDYSMDEPPKYNVEECKSRDATYAAPIKVRVRLRNCQTGNIKEQEIFMGDFPLMTDGATFVINGAERVIVSQIVRSPGMYYGIEADKAGNISYTTTVIPYRGAWLEYETDYSNVFYVRIDKNRKIPITCLLRAIGLKTDAQILEAFGEDERIVATLEKDTCKTYEEAMLEIYRKLRPGEPPTVDSCESLIQAMFFDPRRYDLSAVGRYKFNKKMDIARRLTGHTVAQPVIDPWTGEIIAMPGETLTRERAQELAKRGVNEVILSVDGGEKEVKVFSNNMVDMSSFVDFDPEEVGVSVPVRFTVLKELLDNYSGDELKQQIRDHLDDLMPKHIIIDDMLASINYLNGLAHGIGTKDDIDHLGNRRLRCVGELLQNQFRIGFSRMERVIRERMTIQDLEVVTPQSLINIRPVTAAIKEFFGSSPLSQFMDQTNPLAELTHKRRISALGPGGLSRERASFDVRDIHYSHYGRLCPIETPEGPNIGLINYLASYARVNKYGFIETPYRKVDKATGFVTDDYEYMTADVEDEFVICQATEPLDENGCLANKRITCRHLDEIIDVDRSRVDYMDISPQMMVSVATAMIPFLENDDANRALMGANMQRQAVPLLVTEAPIVATGQEYKNCQDSAVCVLAEDDGIVERVDANYITVRYDRGDVKTYKLIKFLRSNHTTCINQRPIVDVGQRVKKNETLADGPSTCNGEVALGRNILMGFMTWEGYNYEDAVLLSERMVKEDVFTSIHIEEFDLEARDTKLGPEEITRDIPNVGDDALRDLDDHGIIRPGAEVHAGDILVGKVTPKGETDLTAEERLLRAIFGEKAREVRDTSLKVPHGMYGTVIDVKVFTRENDDDLGPGVNECIRVYIAQKRKISVGDKMAGRHGNKGVVSRIMPVEDMPFLPDGTPLDVVLNPLGVPSRMNIGQVLEVHLGYAAKTLGWKVATPVFNGANETDIKELLKQAGLNENGKSWLYDGRTGQRFDNPVTVGYVYYLKLHHLVDDKIHARSTGPYSLVTQQPLGGKAQFGGQRFGEMEVWALEAYGAAYCLQEMLTVKSDDVTGRVRTYESIVKGNNVPKPGVPESFRVMTKELQGLCLDIRVLDRDGNEVELKDDEDEAEYQSFRKVEEEDFNYGSSASDSEYASAGFTTGKMDEDGNIVSDAPAFEEGSLELDSNDDFE